MESYRAGRAVPVPEPAADAFDLLDQPVVAFGAALVMPVVRKALILGHPLVDGGRQGEQLDCESAPRQEALEPVPGQVGIPPMRTVDSRVRNSLDQQRTHRRVKKSLK